VGTDMGADKGGAVLHLSVTTILDGLGLPRSDRQTAWLSLEGHIRDVVARSHAGTEATVPELLGATVEPLATPPRVTLRWRNVEPPETVWSLG
jgi:hypothetical protein